MTKGNENRKFSSSQCERFVELYLVLLERLVTMDAQLAGNVDIVGLGAEVDELEKDSEKLEIDMRGISFNQIEGLKADLKIDYQKCLDILGFYQLIERNGSVYRGDYEKLPINARQFAVPGLDKIIASISVEQFRQIKKMRDKGWKPRLQLTPIAYSFKTIGGKLAGKLSELQFRNDGQQITQVRYSPVIFEDKLSYDPAEARAVENRTLDHPPKSWVADHNVMEKADWVNDRGGWLVDIVPMSSEPCDLSVTDLDSLVNDFRALNKSGMTLMTYESYLVAQMTAIKEGRYLDGDAYSITQGSFIHDTNFKYFGKYVSYGYLDGGTVNLDAVGTGFTSKKGEFVVRPTIRINLK